MFGSFFKRKSRKELRFTLQWGGWYAMRKENGKYGIWRLLDFNVDSLHRSLYTVEFDRLPTLEDAQRARPAMLHAPQEAAALLVGEPPTYLGCAPLDAASLNGYATYLELALELEPKRIEALLATLIGLSHEEPSVVVLLPDPFAQGRVLLKR